MRKDKVNKFHVELTPELLKRAQERVDYILGEGCLHNGVSEKFDSNVKPEWYDEERFKKAQKLVYENHYMAVSNSSLIGLFLVLQQPIGLIPLLATGQSANVSKLFSRYLNTILHVKQWYASDPFDPNSKSYKSQNVVKTMHKNTGKLMNSKLSIYDLVKRMLEEQNKEKNNNEVTEEEVIKLIKRKNRTWVSQADMVITQHAFVGIIMLEPYACGMHGGKKEDLIEIAYIWKVIGYKIGIEDQFNMFRDLDYDFIYAVCKLMLEQIYIPACENTSSPNGYRMSEGVAISLQPVSPYLRFKPYIKYWYKILNINSYKLNNSNLEGEKYEFACYPVKLEMTEEEKKLQIANGYNGKYIVPNPNIPFEELKVDKFSEKLNHSFYLFHINTILKSHFMRNYIRQVNEKRIAKGLKEKSKIIKLLKKKNYDDDPTKQFSACPFGGGIETKYYEYTEYTLKDVKKVD